MNLTCHLLHNPVCFRLEFPFSCCSNISIVSHTYLLLPRYQRFSEQRNWIQRVWEQVPTAGPGMLGVALVCALCVGAWWACSGALGGAWGEEHYRCVSGL